MNVRNPFRLSLYHNGPYLLHHILRRIPVIGLNKATPLHIVSASVHPVSYLIDYYSRWVIVEIS